MNQFSSQTHRVGGRQIEKVASVYDVLATSNRVQPKPLNIASFSVQDNERLRDHIKKTASVLEGHAFLKVAAEIDKAAFLSGGMDIFTKAKGMIVSKLGIDDASAHELASPVVTQAYRIQEKYGGDENHIVDRLVDEMQNQMMSNSPVVNTPGDVQTTMAVTNTKSLEEHVKNRLIQEAGLSVYEADRVKKSVVSEARDLATVLRPHRMDDIADAVVNVIIHHQDPNVVFNIKDNTVYLAEIKSVLG